MKRLVYVPHVQAFVKSDEGVVDISPYLVSGTINRRVNQVSSAQLTLRNPVSAKDNGATGEIAGNMLWTQYQRKDGSIGARFFPQDPIIITMQRLQGHSVQVFTGYIDKAPYLQFYPGLCTIEASCTLKRLLYTQWDAALPFVRNFLQQFGWTLNSDSGIVNPTAETARIGVNADQLKGQFNDGSIGALLFAVLNVIGDWDHSTIFIEALPPQIRDLVVNLYHQIQGEVKQGEALFDSLITQILGTGTQGTGGGGGGGGSSAGGGRVNSPLLSANQNTFASELSQQTGLDPGVVAAWVISEEPSTASGAPNGANNWLNMGAFDAGNWAGSGNSAWSSPVSGADATAQWMKGTSLSGLGRAGANIPSIIKTAGQSPQTQIAAIQQSGWASSGYPGLQQVYASILAAGGITYTSGNPSGGTTGTAQSQALQAAGIPNSNSLAPNASITPQLSANALLNGTSPGGKSGNSNTTTSSTAGYVNPFSLITRGLSPERIDMGVDYNAPSGSEIVAIGDGIVYTVTPGGSGWTSPLGTEAFIGYTLTSGPLAGKSIFVAEDIVPLVNTGPVKAGQPIARFLSSSTGIETGWATGSGYGALAASLNQQNTMGDPGSWASAAGLNFSAFLQALGAPPGLPNPGGNGPNQTMPAGYFDTGLGITATSAAGGSSTGSMAAAFSTFINLPSIFGTAEALAFTGKRSFMADQPLFPFVEQLCQASLRNFMSMPNGNFFAFFPDYFGFFGRKYYWEIRDIEIIDGRIDLSDDPLKTHVAVAGDVTQYHGTVDVFDLLLTSGIFTIFDALASNYITAPSDIKTGNTVPSPINPRVRETANSKNAALAFLQKYGARPYVEQAPMIRSPFFELFLAFQRFMLLWSKQFQTPFELTFMPELFPGGLVAFPDHHIQCYIEEVEHSFDYTQGFKTMVNLSSPSALDSQSPTSNPSEGLARQAALGSTPPSLIGKELPGGTFSMTPIPH